MLFLNWEEGVAFLSNASSNYVSYFKALQDLGMDSLAERREKMSLKFAKNCLKINNMKYLFPRYLSKCSMKTRNSLKYVENKSQTSRYQKSAVPSMQRMLNKCFQDQRRNLSNILSSEL